MPRTYSLDFRNCVIKNYRSGMSSLEISSVFGISRKSLFNWLSKDRHNALSHYNVRKLYSGGKISPDSLNLLLSEFPDLTLEEISEKFSCCFQAVSQRCKTLGITRKKNHTISRKRSKKA